MFECQHGTLRTTGVVRVVTHCLAVASRQLVDRRLFEFPEAPTSQSDFLPDADNLHGAVSSHLAKTKICK